MNHYKEESRKNWGRESALDDDHLKLGALLRIADATEKMATNYVRLQRERDDFERRYRQEAAAGSRMARRIAALQGVITKLKRKEQPK